MNEYNIIPMPVPENSNHNHCTYCDIRKGSPPCLARSCQGIYYTIQDAFKIENKLKPVIKEKSCASCKHFYLHADFVCRRYPPVYVGNCNGKIIYSWPITTHTSLCGEYEEVIR